MGAADIEAIADMFSTDPATLVIGSDPTEWWIGHDAIINAFKSQLQLSGARRIIPGDLQTFSHGTFGWAADRRSMRLQSGQDLTIRETFIFHKAAGKWRIIQMHASLAATNEMLRGS